MRRRRLSFLIRIWIRDDEAPTWTGEVVDLTNEERRGAVHELDDITTFVAEALEQQLAGPGSPSTPSSRHGRDDGLSTGEHPTQPGDGGS